LDGDFSTLLAEAFIRRVPHYTRRISTRLMEITFLLTPRITGSHRGACHRIGRLRAVGDPKEMGCAGDRALGLAGAVNYIGVFKWFGDDRTPRGVVCSF